MTMRSVLVTAILACGTSLGVGAQASEITGVAEILDSRTIAIGGQMIRLADIDAPSPGQTCERNGASYDCAQEAAWALAERLDRHWVLCIERRRDDQGIALATCYLGGQHGIDVNAHMVRRGWAVADPQGGANYTEAENAAQRERLGLWAGAFSHPAEARARRLPR
jgi:endonuclease YncB( thermonuclease family)